MAKKQKLPHLLGSKCTACQRTFGWRHFQVVNRKNQGAWVYAELVSSCDRTVRFWINAKVLKDKTQWQPGWTPLNELAVVDEAEMLDDGTLQILPDPVETPGQSAEALKVSAKELKATEEKPLTTLGTESP